MTNTPGPRYFAAARAYLISESSAGACLAVEELIQWAEEHERSKTKGHEDSATPEPRTLPELQALINQAERAEARAQALTDRLKKVEALAATCGEEILRMLRG